MHDIIVASSQETPELPFPQPRKRKSRRRHEADLHSFRAVICVCDTAVCRWSHQQHQRMWCQM